MENNMKNIVVTCCFLVIIIGFMFANIFVPDGKLSYSERRELVQLPSYTNQKLLNGELLTEFEKYTLDQFVLRDEFRTLKVLGRFGLFQQKDNNGVYLADGRVYKIEYPLDEASVLNAAQKYNEIYERFLKGMNVYYSIVPDKNYFIASRNGYLSIDYNKMVDIMNANVRNMKYIDIFDSLSIDDYYHTDLHWREDRILDVADKLLSKMGNPSKASDMKFTSKKLYPFYGSFYGQSALPVSPDTLIYLTNDIIENCTVYDYQYKTYEKVYSTGMFDSIDPYSLYLSGPKPLLTIENSAQRSGRELYIFRDSFGSSIAPLLISGYSKITLIDLRYITPDILGSFIKFDKDGDALFLHNTLILNESALLK